MASEGTSRSLQDTPTWALATVCFIFIFLSIFIEHLIHLLSQFLKRHKKTALFEAVEKLKSVLMLLGFMSLILTVTQRWIASICIPTKAAYTMLPCRKTVSTKTTKALGFDGTSTTLEVIQRRLAETATSTTTTTSSEDQCESKGKSTFISQGGLNQLNNFIFVLAIMQIVYSVLTMALGRAKMRRWEAWERETQTLEYQVANDPNRFRFTRQTTFARRHMNSCTRTPIQLWIKCFFRQFFHSVEKVDYLTLRHGFVATHLPTNNASFNFQQYIQRSLEEDFRAVVGISPVMWLIVVIFILVDVHGWQAYLWVSFLPLIIVLVLGTKMEVVVAKMAQQLGDKNNVIKGVPLVQPDDSHFWFSQPQFVLTLVHLTLFMNAFELAFFIWVTLQYGIHSCYHENIDIIIIRVVLAIVVQVMCSYITLPLYALVTQMGSNFKSTAVLEEQTTKVIKQWHADVKQKRKKNRQDNSESGHDFSSTIGSSSRRTMTSTDFSSHHRQPTFAEMSQIEIDEDGQEIVEHGQDNGGQNEIELSSTVLSPVVQIEISGADGTQT